MKVELKELGLGDVIRLDMQAFGDATVKKINEDGTVVAFRPYVATSDFSCGNSVICYVGIEEFTLHGAPVELVRKGGPLK